MRRAGSLLVTAALLAAGTLPVAWAQTRGGRTAQGKVRTLNACVALVPTMGGPLFSTPPGTPPGPPPDPDALVAALSPNPNPYVFYVLNERKDLRPDGWQFRNPAAPAFSGREHQLRWWSVTGNVNALPVGSPMRPDMAAYWEVPLSAANFNRLSQMDVIYLPISRRDGSGNPLATHFTEDQRRILARLADAGVTIWLDWALDRATAGGALGGNENPALGPTGRQKNTFFTNLDFAAFTGSAATPPTSHPLLSAEFFIPLGDGPKLGRAYGMNAAGVNRAVETRALDMQATANFEAVVPLTSVNPTTGAFVAAGRYGSGYVVATAGNVGAAISHMIAANVVRVTGQDLGLAEPEDLKFGYNVFAWSSEVTAGQKNGRHTAQGNVAVDGMIEQGTFPHLLRPSAAGTGAPWPAYPPVGLPAGSLPINPSPPLVLDGLVIAALRWNTGAGILSEIRAFETNPAGDWDGNSFIDDPINAGTPATHPFADISIGMNYDCVEGTVPGGAGTVIYGMTAGNVPTAALGAAPFLFAAGNTGIYSLPVPIPGVPWSATTAPASGNVGVQFTGAPAFTIVPGQGATTLAQLYAGGIQQSPLFGNNNNGKLLSFNVAPGNGALAPAWYYPPNQEANRLGAVSGPVVTAQVQDMGTGAIDTMLFTTSVSPDAGGVQAGNAGDTTGKVEGWVVASRGDPLLFPVGNNAPGGSNPQAGRQFVSARWLNIPPGQGQVPQARELLWDPNRHYEVRVMDKNLNYVLARFVPGWPGFNLVPNGTGGQVELPPPTGALAPFAMPGQPNVWNLNDFVLLADYSVLPIPVDTGGATIRPRFTPPTPYLRGVQQQVQPTGVGGGVSVGKDNLVYYGTGQGYMCAAEWRRGRAGFRWKMRGVTGEYQNNTGLSQNVDPTAAGYLDDYAFVASPAAGDRVVFASRRTGTVYVMEPDATVRFKLQPAITTAGGQFPPIQWTAAKAQEVMLQGDHGLGFVPTSPGLMANQQPWGRVPNQFEVDPDTGTVTFRNMENFSLDLSAARSSAYLAATYGIDTGGRPAVPINWWLRTGGPTEPTTMNPARAWVPLPLVAIYQPASPTGERWLSGPVISGDKIFLMGQSGTMHELPLDPKTLDPRFPRRADDAGVRVDDLRGHNMGDVSLYAPNGLRRTRNVAAGPGMPVTTAPPAVSQGIVATMTPRGLTMYTSPNIVVADSNRVIEASGNSTALAVTDAVVKHRIDVSEFAIPTDPAFANTVVGGVARPILTERKILNRPTVVKKLDRRSSFTALFNSSSLVDAPVDGIAGVRQNPEWAEDSFLAADTGNNRAVEFNAAGKVVWECTDLYDPMNILPAGEPLRISQPMDVQRWVETEIVPGFAQPVYVIHTLIADTGNTRVIEVVDKVLYQQGVFNAGSFVTIPGQRGADGQDIRWYHVVVWSSQTNAQGLKLRYRTAQRVYWPDPAGNRIGLPASMVDPPAGQAYTVPPYLPKERALSYTMAAVSGQNISYPPQGVTASGYFRSNGSPQQSVFDRKPTVRPGGDSIVFLRGLWKVDETTAVPAPVTGTVNPIFGVREARQGASAADQYRFAQGVIDPNLPVLTEIYDEMDGAAPASNSLVHRLNGVASVQLTVRADGKLAPETYVNGPMVRYPYFLIADTDGVWEFRIPPGTMLPRLSLAFTNEDYAYVTGAGNGDPASLYNPAAQTPGGRRFNAASARRMPSGLILVTSRTTANEQPRVNMANLNTQLNAGADVFLLRASDYRTAAERRLAGGAAPYNRIDVTLHGWQADLWVQTVYQGNIPAFMRGAPSIRWRAADLLDPTRQPTLNTQLEGGNNPPALTGSYIPVQPTFADMAF